VNFKLKLIIACTFRWVFKLMSTRSLGPSKVQGQRRPIKSTENELMTVSWKSQDLPLKFVSSHVCTWQNTTCLHRTVAWCHAHQSHSVRVKWSIPKIITHYHYFLLQAKCFLPSNNIIPITATLNYSLYLNQNIMTLYVSDVLRQYFTSVSLLNSQIYNEAVKEKFGLLLIACTLRDRIHVVYHIG